MIVFGGLIVFGFLYYLYTQYSSFALAPVLIIDQPQDKVEITEDFLVAQGQTDKDAQLYINGQQVQLSDDGSFSVRIDGLQDGLNTLTFVAKNDFDKQREEQRSVFVNVPSPTTEVVEKPKDAETSKGVNVSVEIGPNASWLQVYTDDTLAFEGVLLSGAMQTFEAKEKIKLSTGNAGSTSVTVNGKSQGSLGNEGEIVEREYAVE